MACMVAEAHSHTQQRSCNVLFEMKLLPWIKSCCAEVLSVLYIVELSVFRTKQATFKSLSI